ncbi:UbiA family prenyltransferase [Simkania negevensis]|uniref:UbiA family prenyltransferase n=1 Tax=Simkania negevensis TaxID=83561 RepID=A0ABS3AP99_9BACT|nr:UbiA family prenyltransferase [Simkania negevensis]
MIVWKTFRRLILLEQTLFGLPWAFAGAILPLAIPNTPLLAFGPLQWLFIVLAFFFARTAGMSFNRLIDRKIDGDNPRTRMRVLPSGEATPLQVGVLAWTAAAGFVVTCGLINMPILLLSPLLLLLLIGYSYTKRFTSLCHFVLGAIQFFVPICAWIAITGVWAWPPVFLGLAALTLFAGTDIVYQMQDLSFDKKRGLVSLPVVLGIEKSMTFVRLLHIASITCLVALSFFLSHAIIYLVGVGCIATIFLYMHWKLSLHSYEVGRFFFRCNTLVGVSAFIICIGALL